MENYNHQALDLLLQLPEGWEWSVSKHGQWWHIVIRNDGLKHEPCYTSAEISKGSKYPNTPESRSLLACTRFAYREYLKGEKLPCADAA